MAGPVRSISAGDSLRPVSTLLSVGVVVVPHLALLVLDPAALTTFVLVAVEGGLLVVVVGIEYFVSGASTTELYVVVIAWCLLIGTVLLATQMWDPWFTAVVLVIAVGFVLYVVHRLELTRLGLVEVTDGSE